MRCPLLRAALEDRVAVPPEFLPERVVLGSWHDADGFPGPLQALRLLDGLPRVLEVQEFGGAGDQFALGLHVAGIFAVESRLQVVEQRVEAGLQRLYHGLVHRRVLLPLASRLEQDLADQVPVRLLAGLFRCEGRQPLEQRFAPRLVLLALLRLPGEVLATGLVGALGRLVELLPFRCGILPSTPMQGAPFVPQPADLPRELFGGEIGADQGLHPFDQLGSLRHDAEGLPVLEFLELRVDVLQFPIEPLGQRGGLGSFAAMASRSRAARAVPP